MPEEFITRTEYEKRHDSLAKEIAHVDARVDKVEVSLDAKDTESQKVHAEIKREQTESYLKLLEAIHNVKDEVNKDRIATINMEATLKGEIVSHSLVQSNAMSAFQKSLTDNKNKTYRWIIGLIVTLVAGSGIGVIVEVLRVLLTGKP